MFFFLNTVPITPKRFDRRSYMCFYNNGYVVPIIYTINYFITSEPPIASLTLNWLIYWGNYHTMIHNKSFNCLFRKKVRHIIGVSQFTLKVMIHVSTLYKYREDRYHHLYFKEYINYTQKFSGLWFMEGVVAKVYSTSTCGVNYSGGSM